MHINRRHFFLGASNLALWPLLARAGKLDEQLPASGAKLRFAVRLDKADAGRHHITFRDDKGHVHIEHEMDILLKIAFVTAYSLKHTSTETWSGIGRDAQLLSLSSETMEDGTNHKINGNAGKDYFSIETYHGEIAAPLDIATTNSFWADAAILRPHLIDSMDGSLIQSRVDEISTTVEGRVQKEHVRLHADDRSAEAWFENDILVSGKMLRKGHAIYYHIV